MRMGWIAPLLLALAPGPAFAESVVLVSEGEDAPAATIDVDTARAVMRELHDWASRDWPKVEAVVADAKAAPPGPAGAWQGELGVLYLAADGRGALLRGSDDDAEEDDEAQETYAMLLEWRADGDDLELLNPQAVTAPRERFSDEEVEEFLESFGSYYAGLPPQDLVQRIRDEYEATARSDQSRWMRTVLLQDGANALLLDRERLLAQAQRWSGEGALQLAPAFWRSSGEDSPLAAMDPRAPGYALADPLHPGVPKALRDLLRVQAIETRVVAHLDADAPLQWSHHSAQVRLRLDRGSDDGLIEGMALYDLPPNEGWYAELSQVGADESVATMHLSRFAPDDEMALPARGTAFTTRRDAPLRCGVDTSAAVRAAITFVSAPADGVTLDADGYAYLDLEVDQGRGEGLAVGDRLYLEQDADSEARIAGEGRVRQVGADSTRVLWRTYRWLGAWEEDEDAGEGAAPVKVERSALPAVGQHLVTPAWRRVESDLFGALRGR